MSGRQVRRRTRLGKMEDGVGGVALTVLMMRGRRRYSGQVVKPFALPLPGSQGVPNISVFVPVDKSKLE